jgi:hypothetical protein
VVGRVRGTGQVLVPARPAPTTSVPSASTVLQPPAAPSETTRPAPPPVPVSPTGVVRRERQGYELTLPDGWKVDQSTTRSSYQFGQPWLVISPGGRAVSAGDDRRITVYTAVTPPSQYPGKPVKGHDVMGGQSFSTLSGKRSSGRRADGRAWVMGDQGGVVGYLIGWPYRCEPVIGRGGQGDYAWEMVARKGSGQDYWVETRRQNGDLLMGESFSALDNPDVAWVFCTPSKERATTMLVSGMASEETAKVVLELKGRPSKEVQTFSRKGFPFAFWVVAPLPPDARPVAFIAFDAGGKQVDRETSFAGYPGGCR